MPSELQGEDVCEVWSQGSLHTPEHSKLVPLKPIGVGTPLVESLTSYVARLAATHSVPPFELLTCLLLPEWRDQTETGTATLTELCNRTIKSSSNINGLGPRAQRWVNAIEHAAGRKRLDTFTMLPFASILSVHGLLSPKRAWCPVCFHDWRQVGQVLYEPLLWQIAQISACPVHGCCLRRRCSHEDCGAAQWPLGYRLRPGYCSTCLRWLGEAQSQSGKRHDHTRSTQMSQSTEPARQWSIWAAREIGQLLSLSSTDAPLDDRRRIVAMLNETRRRLMKSNGPMYGTIVAQRELGMAWGGLAQFADGHANFSLELILRLCSWLQLSPSEVLFDSRSRGANYSTVIDLPPQSHALPAPRKHRKLSKFEVKQYLDGIIQHNETPPPSVNQIGIIFGCWPGTLSRICPQETAAISARRNAWVAARKRERRAAIEEEVYSVMMARHAQGLSLNMAAVGRDMSKPRIMLDPWAVAVWRRVRQELGLDS